MKDMNNQASPYSEVPAAYILPIDTSIESHKRLYSRSIRWNLFLVVGFFSAIFLVYGLLFSLVPTGNSEFFWAATSYILTALMLLIPYLLVRRALTLFKNNKLGRSLSCLILFADGFVIKTGDNNSLINIPAERKDEFIFSVQRLKIPYQLLYSVVESKDSFDIFLNRTEAVVIRKQDCSIQEIQFLAAITDRFGLKKIEYDTNRAYKWFGTVIGIVLGLLACFAMMLSSGMIRYGSGQGSSHSASGISKSVSHPSDQRLVKVVYDKDYVKRSGLSPQRFAKTTRTLMKVRVKKAYAAKDGSVVQVMTESQRKKIIYEFKDFFHTLDAPLHRDSKEYRYVISGDYGHLDVWMDEKVSMDAYGLTVSSIPSCCGYLYYLEGHRGPWDMRIRIYNCHSGKLKLSFSYWKQPHVVWPLKILK